MKLYTGDVYEVDVRDQHPLKQGLRLLLTVLEILTLARVRDQHPLKQGLRLPAGSYRQFSQSESETNIH